MASVQSQICVSFPPAVYQEIDRLARSNKTNRAEIVRQLVFEILAQKAEEMTDTQFKVMNDRLASIEKRFAAFQAKNVRISAKGAKLAQFVLRGITDDDNLYNQLIEKAEREGDMALQKLSD